MASFRFTEAFESRLEELAEKHGKTKTAMIVDAVNAYAVGNLPDSELISLLNQLANGNAEIHREIDELKTLVTQVLKNQQATN